MKWWLRASFCQGKQVQSSWNRGARGPAEPEALHLLGSQLWLVQAWLSGNSSAMVLRERPARKLGAIDQGLLGAECWNLPRERKRHWRLVSQRNHCLIRQASTECLLCSRLGALGQKKQEVIFSVLKSLQSVGTGLWTWWLDKCRCNCIFQSARTRRFQEWRVTVSFKGFWQERWGHGRALWAKWLMWPGMEARRQKSPLKGNKGSNMPDWAKMCGGKMCKCTTGQRTLQAGLENRCMVQDATGTPWKFGIHRRHDQCCRITDWQEVRWTGRRNKGDALWVSVLQKQDT